MIHTYKNGQFVAVAESVSDVKYLLAHKSYETTDTTPTVRKHKKHNFRKKCEHCSKSYKGIQGLGIHLMRKHGIPKESRHPKAPKPEPLIVVEADKPNSN